MKYTQSLLKLVQEAKTSSNTLRLNTTEEKNKALELIAKMLEKEHDLILKANAEDLKIGRSNQLSEALLDRLSLEGRLPSIIADVRHLISLSDPIGKITEEQVLPNGLLLQKKCVPIGVLGVIYEARPNVTVDIASLALKTSNCVILRGGKETLNTNIALMHAIKKALDLSALPVGSVGLIKNKSRSQVKQLLKLDQYIDMIIPRGGQSLHQFCKKESLIPVITGGIGICHLFVDETGDVERSINVIDNAKTQRPTVCNALDTLLVHKAIAPVLIPKLIERLKKKNVSFRLDQKAWNIHSSDTPGIVQAEENDWKTEWLSLILGIKVVDSLEDAISHIQTHSSGHSDGILTNDPLQAKKFIESIDSAAVYINASTRFTDGGQFGLGAEVAVSTQKLHARGPMGLKELTTYKWIATGDYHIRSDS